MASLQTALKFAGHISGHRSSNFFAEVEAEIRSTEPTGKDEGADTPWQADADERVQNTPGLDEPQLDLCNPQYRRYRCLLTKQLATGRGQKRLHIKAASNQNIPVFNVY